MSKIIRKVISNDNPQGYWAGLYKATFPVFTRAKRLIRGAFTPPE
jgi:hypothetical protein